MEPDAPLADSSSADAQAPVALRALDSLNASELDAWRLTGDLPTAPAPDTSSPAESTPAEPAAQAASTDASQDPPASETGTPGKKRGADARVQELLAERHQMREEIARLRAGQQASSSSQSPDDRQAASSPAAAQGEAFPKFDAWAAKPENDGKDFEDYTQAVVLHTLEQRESLRERQAAIHAVAASFAERFEAAKAADPSFVTSLSPDVLSLQTVQQAEAAGIVPTALHYAAQEIVQSEQAVALLRHFSAHPEALTALQHASPAAAIRAIAKLEATFEASASPGSQAPPPAPSLTNAPDPPRTLGARPAAPLNEAEAAVGRGDFTAYRDAMNREELAARGA